MTKQTRSAAIRAHRTYSDALEFLAGNGKPPSHRTIVSAIRFLENEICGSEATVSAKCVKGQISILRDAIKAAS